MSSGGNRLVGKTPHGCASLSLASPPQRVVSLVPSITESLFDLGLGALVVGVTDYCIHPGGALMAVPRIGGPKTPDLERILALQPDLVIANQEENRKVDAEALQAAGLQVWITFPRTVAQSLEMLWDLVTLFHSLERAASLMTIERVLDWTERAATQREPVRVFCPIWRNPWMTIGTETYTHDLLRVCGGHNVFADWRGGSRYPAITLGDVVDRCPEIILLPSEPFRFGEAHRDELASYPGMPDRIFLVDGTLLTWFGTRMGKALRLLPALIERDRSSH